MNPCATFSPPIMYTPNEYREKNSWPLFFFFFSLKSKIKYSSKIRRYRNFSEFSVEKKYVSNDIKKRKGKEREKTFYSSKILFYSSVSSTFEARHNSPSIRWILETSPPPRNTTRDIASYLVFRCSKDSIRNIRLGRFRFGRRYRLF